MIDHDLVLSRLALIDGNLAHLEKLRGTPRAEFLTQVEKWASARYLIQTSIEAMIDVCNHIIAGQRWGSPSTHQQALALLAQHGALANSRLDDYRGMIRFRNMLVHLYHIIDDEKSLSCCGPGWTTFALSWLTFTASSPETLSFVAEKPVAQYGRQ